MTITGVYLKLLAKSWAQTGEPTLQDIPVATQSESEGTIQLQKRVNEFDESGITGKWLNDIKSKSKTWRSVRDLKTGHTIHVVSNRSHKELTADLRLGLRILKWMSHKQPITWFWWDHDNPRILPPFTPPAKIHLNGGWTTIGRGPKEVHVYRREEAHKVLIHECIHSLGLDVTEGLDVQRTVIERSLGGCRLYPHLGEAYTEFYAEFLWASIKGNGSQRAWSFQLACSAGQARDLWARIKETKYNEDTSVFAYYILKWVLMLHTEEMLLDPKGTVKLWASWWLTAKPALDRESLKVRIDRPLALGMTCIIG